MQKYPTYKPSNIDWIGEIPSHWVRSKVKWKLTFHNNRRIPIEADKRGDLQGEYPYYGASGIIDYVNEYIFDGVYILVGEDGANILSRSTPLAFLAEGKYWVNNHAHILKANNLQDKYYAYQIELNDFTTIASGSAQPKLTKEALGDLQLIVPPLQEQQAIVTYLDEKTTLIDELIAKKQSKIALLKEQRTALINHAVTKGLNAKVAFKDSKIEWIGEIPENWRVKKLKFVGDFQNGISKGAEYFGEGYPFMNYGDVYKNEVTPSEVEGKVQSDEKEREQYSILRGDVFFTRTSESKDDIGISSTCLSSISNCVFSGFVIRFRFFQITHIPEYSKYHFQTHWKKVFIESQMNIVTRSSLSQQVLGQVPVLIPPISEQQAIVAYLDEQTVLIDKNIELESQKIEKLKEYRQSLISNVVTGKICVA